MGLTIAVVVLWFVGSIVVGVGFGTFMRHCSRTDEERRKRDGDWFWREG